MALGAGAVTEGLRALAAAVPEDGLGLELRHPHDNLLPPITL